MAIDYMCTIEVCITEWISMLPLSEQKNGNKCIAIHTDHQTKYNTLSVLIMPLGRSHNSMYSFLTSQKKGKKSEKQQHNNI